MDVFSLRNRLINDYASYVQSFIHLRDPLISIYMIMVFA